MSQVSPDAVGTQFEAVTVKMERGRLQFFAKAIGQQDPVYVDVAAARAAGHPDLPVPPTFLFSLEFEQPDPLAYLSDLGIDLGSVMHGEERFDYTRLAFAGETLTAKSHVADVYAKRGGSLEFVEIRTTLTRDDGDEIAVLSKVLVIRHAEAST